MRNNVKTKSPVKIFSQSLNSHAHVASERKCEWSVWVGACVSVFARFVCVIQLTGLHHTNHLQWHSGIHPLLRQEAMTPVRKWVTNNDQRKSPDQSFIKADESDAGLLLPLLKRDFQWSLLCCSQINIISLTKPEEDKNSLNALYSRQHLFVQLNTIQSTCISVALSKMIFLACSAHHIERAGRREGEQQVHPMTTVMEVRGLSAWGSRSTTFGASSLLSFGIKRIFKKEIVINEY